MGTAVIRTCMDAKLFYGSILDSYTRKPVYCAFCSGDAACASAPAPGPGGSTSLDPSVVRPSGRLSGCSSCGKQPVATGGAPGASTGPAGIGAKPVSSIPWWFWILVLLGLAQIVYGKDTPLLT